jgi:Cdc6-like AAA superfamily ATPase
MTDLWYRNFGYKENPLTIKPAALHDEVVAYDLEDIYDKIESGDVVFIEGPYGTGKSTILKNVINEFGGDKRIIYYSANRSGSKCNFRKIIADKQSFVSKLFKAKPKGLVLLIDESEYLSADDFDELTNLRTSGVVKAILFVGSSFDKLKINSYFLEAVKENVISLTQLEEDEAVSLIRSRLGDLEFISDDVIKKIYNISEKNPRLLLKNIEEICRYAYDFGDEKVLDEHIEEVFGKESLVQSA